MSKNEKWITRKEFYDTPKSKKEAYYLEKIGPLGEELIGKFYNKLDKEPEQEEGSMTRSEFIELHKQLSAKSEQRISDILTTKFDQMEQKRLADKAEAEQKCLIDKQENEQRFTNFKNEFLEMYNNDKEENNKKFALIFTTLENNQTQLTDMLYEIKADVEMLKSFHKEDIKKYKENKIDY